MSKPPVIMWFRRDLRLDDNKALHAAIASGQPVIPLFVFDPAILKSPRVGAPRLKFMLQALDSMATELHKHQRDLLIRHGDPAQLIPALIAETDATALYYNIDYTPYAVKRDEQIVNALAIEAHGYHDRLLAPPGTVEKNDGGPYTVYTPFKKKWRALDKDVHPAEYDVTADELHNLDGLENDGIATVESLGFEATINVPEASEKEAQRRLDTWVDEAVYAYDEERNQLGNPAHGPLTRTSFLSPYIRFGVISPRRIYQASADAYRAASNESQRQSVVAFVDEIIWHEFYTHVLHFFPQVTTHNFNRKYDAVEWLDDNEAFEAWRDGMTGYPAVDAAMRQLKSTGWMHNRARMIVASFLTKHLLIDWRRGELHFMQWLIDGDLAANNGGWQWAAGTGTDAQPYFRIFNPISQSQKFDPDGEFIRYWIPELHDVPDKFIHTPWEMERSSVDYPAPIVDHKMARQRALDAYGATKEADRS